MDFSLWGVKELKPAVTVTEMSHQPFLLICVCCCHTFLCKYHALISNQDTSVYHVYRNL